MKLNELDEDFYNQFLHLCYEFHEEYLDCDFFQQKFWCLVHVSLHGECEPHDVSTSPTLKNHEKPLISEEEFTAPFVICPPPFPFLMMVPLCKDNKFGKNANQIPNPYFDSSSTYHYSN